MRVYNRRPAAHKIVLSEPDPRGLICARVLGATPGLCPSLAPSIRKCPCRSERRGFCVMARRPALFRHRALQQLDAFRERALHQQGVDAIGYHAKAFGAEVARPSFLVAGEKARRLVVLAAGPDQSIDRGMEYRIVELPRDA
jgi:hypothetical protein